MSKKGFTLVELLAVIVIIGVIFGIAVPSYKNHVEKSNELKYRAYGEAMVDAANLKIINGEIKTEGKFNLSDLGDVDIGECVGEESYVVVGEENGKLFVSDYSIKCGENSYQRNETNPDV